MTDKHEALRAALAAGPTPGPWFADNRGKVWCRDPRELYENGGGVAGDKALATTHVGWYGEGYVGFPAECNARLIAAANPEAIRALLAERDALREALQGVLRVADRATDEFDAARAALSQEPT